MVKRQKRSYVLRQLKKRIDEIISYNNKNDHPNHLSDIEDQLFQDLKDSYNYCDATIKHYLRDIKNLGYLTYEYIKNKEREK